MRLLRATLTFVTIAALAACGNSKPIIDTPVGPGAGAVTVSQETLTFAAALNVQNPAILMREATVVDPGQVDVRVDWQESTNDIDIIVTETACANGIDAYNGKCTVL